MMKKKKILLICVLFISITFIIASCNALENEQLEGEPQGLVVSVDIPEKLINTEDVTTLTLEENININEVIVVLKDENEEELITLSESIKDEQEKVELIFNDIEVGVGYKVQAEILGTIREENNEKTLYKGQVDDIKIERDSIAEVNVKAKALNAKSISLNIDGDSDLVDKVIIEHPTDEIKYTQKYNSNPLIFENGVEYDGNELNLFPSRWKLNIISDNETVEILTPLLLPTEEKKLNLSIDITAEGNIKPDISIITSPNTPENLVIDENNNLTWGEIDTAQNYLIYKTITDDKTEVNRPEDVYNVSDNFFSNAEPNYYYWVRAYSDIYSSDIGTPVFNDIITNFDKHNSTVEAVKFSSDDSMVVSGSRDETVKVWDTFTGEIINSFDEHESSVRSLDISSDDSMIASGDGLGKIHIWNIDNKEIINTIEESHGVLINSISFSSDDSMIAYRSYSGNQLLKVWDTHLEETKIIIDTNDKYVNSLNFSSDDNKIIIAEGNVAIIRSVETGEIIETLDEHPDDVNVWTANFSSDDNIIALGLSNGNIQIWEYDNSLEKYQLINSFRNHNNDVVTIKFSSDDSMVVSGSHDGTVKIWDTYTGEMITAFDKHESSIRSVDISSDDSMVVSGSSDNKVKVWTWD